MPAVIIRAVETSAACWTWWCYVVYCLRVLLCHCVDACRANRLVRDVPYVVVVDCMY